MCVKNDDANKSDQCLGRLPFIPPPPPLWNGKPTTGSATVWLSTETQFFKMHGQNFKNVRLQFSCAANGSWKWVEVSGSEWIQWKSVEVSGSQWRWLQLLMSAQCKWWILTSRSHVKVGTHSSHPFIEIKENTVLTVVSVSRCVPPLPDSQPLAGVYSKQPSNRMSGFTASCWRINTRQSWEFSDTKDKRDKTGK